MIFFRDHEPLTPIEDLLQLLLVLDRLATGIFAIANVLPFSPLPIIRAGTAVNMTAPHLSLCRRWCPASSLPPEHGTGDETGGLVLQAGQHVRVLVQRERRRGVPEPLADGLGLTPFASAIEAEPWRKS